MTGRMPSAGLLVALVVLVSVAPANAAERYRNPLPVTIPATGEQVETFADPHVIRGHDGAYTPTGPPIP